MYSRHRVAGYSIDHVIKFLFFLLVPVVILDIMISCFVIFSMRSQSIQSLQDTTSLYASQIDTAHISINRYLIRLLTENDDADTLLETQDKLEFISSAERVHNNIDIFLESFEKGYQIFLYNSENERMYRPTEIFQTLTQNQLVLLNKHLIQKITAPKTSFYTDAWEVLMLGKNVYFYKSFHTGSHYACCFIPADNIIQPLKNIIKEKDGFISLTSQNGTVLTNKELLKQHHIEFSRKSNSDSYETYNKGNNLIISGALIMGAFYPQIILSKFRAYEKIILLQFILALAVLQLQIRPRFFLNCLNTIYSMAQTQLYEEIMKMSMITSNYFRYIFQNTQDLVPVKNELEHIKNYMEIQKMRYGDTFSYEIHAEEGTENIRIPPILIQTFIENAIKHSNTFDEPIIIRTDIAWMTAGGNSHENIQIQVMDTGCGFSEDILQSLNSAIPLEPQNGHRIGITNAIQRLNLLYGQGEAVITFSNLPSGGACVTILLPAV